VAEREQASVDQTSVDQASVDQDTEMIPVVDASGDAPGVASGGGPVERTRELPVVTEADAAPDHSTPAAPPAAIGQVPTGLSRDRALREIQPPEPAFWLPPPLPGAAPAGPPQPPAPSPAPAPGPTPVPSPMPVPAPAPAPVQRAVPVLAPERPASGRSGLGWATARNLLLGAAVLIVVLLVVGLGVLGNGDPAGQQAPAASGQDQPAAELAAQISSLDPSPGGSGFRESDDAWVTQTYRSRDFGNLKDGVGLELDLGAEHTVESVRFDAGSGPLTVELLAADSAGQFEAYQSVGSPESASGRTTLSGQDGGAHRYWLIWVTRLGNDNRAQISDVTVAGQ
jgi:hypothetical protein